MNTFMKDHSDSPLQETNMTHRPKKGGRRAAFFVVTSSKRYAWKSLPSTVAFT